VWGFLVLGDQLAGETWAKIMLMSSPARAGLFDLEAQMEGRNRFDMSPDDAFWLFFIVVK